MKSLVRWDGGEATADFSRPIDIAIALDFSSEQPRHFGAPAAHTQPCAIPGFSGAVDRGASCNCNVITLIPHCNGTHTECVGHLTTERLDAHRHVPTEPLPALLVSVEPAQAHETAETSDPKPQTGDRLITRSALENAWRTAAPSSFRPCALVVRTLPNDRSKISRDYSDITPPYLSREAAQFLVAQGVDHLLVDLPSIDRAHDEGRLTAHRIFFGLPAGSTSLAAATRECSTVTELAFIPDEVADGPYLLQIHVPAIGGDAVPSRPLLYMLESP